METLKRVLLKLSGEALAGTNQSGYDDERIMDIARQVKQIVDKGLDVGIVIGGGNYWRGRSNDNIDRTKADQIGMLATVMNCIYVSELFRSYGIKTEILTPFECGTMTKRFSKDRANKYFSKLLYFSLEAQDILTFLQIQELFCVRLKWMPMPFFWQKPLMASMTVTQRKIQMQKNMKFFQFRKLLIKSLESLI